MPLRAQMSHQSPRDYGAVVSSVKPGSDREATMRAVVDALWDATSARGVSWAGFYTIGPGGQEMILGPSRNKPACSPIGLHGVCGQSFTARKPMIVADVATLGPNYIACDPRDKSEVVLPLFEADGTCWGVLDVDSHEVGAFDQSDVVGLRRVLERAGLSVPQNPIAETVRL